MKIAFLCFFLCSCVAPSGKNDCLVQAIGFQDSYKWNKRFEPHRWTRILGIFWDKEKKLGHAVHVFEHSGKIMVQGAGDKKMGWVMTRNLSLKDSPKTLANFYSPNTGIVNAYYYEDK
jgi:hypothetical protein